MHTIQYDVQNVRGRYFVEMYVEGDLSTYMVCLNPIDIQLVKDIMRRDFLRTQGIADPALEAINPKIDKAGKIWWKSQVERAARHKQTKGNDHV